MRTAPEGWPRISSSLFYDDAALAIDFLGRAPEGHHWWFMQRVREQGTRAD